MLGKSFTRRTVIKSTAVVAGAAAARAAVAGKTEETEGLSLEQAAMLHQKEYIAAKLARITHRSRTVTTKEIADFADAFTAVYGVVDYRKMFSRIDGEFRLARLFVGSTLISRG